MLPKPNIPYFALVTNQDICDHSLYIDNIKIDKVSTYKYLDITLDSNLTYNKHLENTIKTILYKALLLARMRKYITLEDAFRIY